MHGMTFLPYEYYINICFSNTAWRPEPPCVKIYFWNQTRGPGALTLCLVTWYLRNTSKCINCPFRVTTSRFGDTSCQKSECTERPQTELEHLTVKSTLYTLNIYPEAQIVIRFALRLAVPEIHEQGRWNSEMHRMIQTELKHLTVSIYSILYIQQLLTSEDQIWVLSTLRLTVSEIQHVQGRRKSEMHRMTPNRTWTLNSSNYFINTEYLPLGSKF